MSDDWTFDIVVCGSGGGQNEGDLSAYLLKPRSKSWADGIIALEAGSGKGALSKILAKDPLLFGEQYSAAQLYSFVRCFLLTHAHMDHIASLIVSAGSFSGPRKRIYASMETLKDLESVFKPSRIWPNLASWNEQDDPSKYLYSALPSGSKFHPILSDVSVSSFPLNHGTNDLGEYGSTAFLIRHDLTNRSFLFFGDVEPDSLAKKAKTINVWRTAAPMIPDSLSTIFIECSWPSKQPDHLLYGHLNPKHLVSELMALAREVLTCRTKSVASRQTRKRQKTAQVSDEDLKGVLAGLRVFIMHCKDDLNGVMDKPIQQVILEEVLEVLKDKELGVEVQLAEQGMTIRI